MPRRLRHLKPGTTVEITIRTIQGRYLLRPSNDLNEIILGIIAVAQAMYGLEIHFYVFMSNHYHLLATIPDAKALSNFECFLNGNLARQANQLHGWTGAFWSERYTAISILDDEAMVNRAHYLLSHGCKEGLVERPQDWPGVSSLQSILRGRPDRGFWFNRTSESAARRCGLQPDRYEFATSHEVHLTPLPCWAHLPPADHKAVVRDLVAQIEQETRHKNLEEEHRPPGRQYVLTRDPLHRPDHPKKSVAPPCHTTDYEMRKAFMLAYTLFLDAYTEASAQLRAGHRDTEFPADCFPPSLPYQNPVISTAPT